MEFYKCVCVNMVVEPDYQVQILALPPTGRATLRRSIDVFGPQLLHM